MWEDQLAPISTKPFSSPVGPRVAIPSGIKETFSLFFTTTVLQHIVDQSNNYALDFLDEVGRRESWTMITLEELQAYMGFMILMGIVKLPSMYDYWKKDEVFHYAPVANKISRDRFLEIHRFLHFADNSTLAAPGTPEYDKLGKVRPLINFLTERFSMVCSADEHVSVDEAMIPFKGRSSLKQYMPKKPVRRGIKVWMRADAESGYVSALEVYTGKKGDNVEQGLGSKVVLSLTEDLKNTYRHIYFDNFFCSAGLLINLFKAGLYGCGTTRVNRKGFPPELKKHTKKGFKERGNSMTYQHRNLTATVWQDTKPVVIMATNSDPTTPTTVERKQRDGSKSTYPCPTSVYMYNKYMGGVDHNDQLRGYYHVRLKCRKYYKYIMWFLFDVAITNSYTLCKLHTDLKYNNIKDFRVNLAKELIGDYFSRKRPGRPPTQPSKKRFCKAHYPTKGPKPRRCHYCYKYKKERHETSWCCKDCDIYLCHNGQDDCFYMYHTRHGPTCN